MSSKIKYFMMLITLAAQLFWAAGILAFEPTSREVEAFVRAVHSSNVADEGIFSMIMQNFDIDSFSAECLKDHEGKLESEQFAEFKKVFFAKLQSLVKSRKIGDLGEYDVDVLNVLKKGINILESKLRIMTKERHQINITLFLTRYKGKLFVTDYEVEGVLLSRQYRAQFNKFLREHTFGELIEKIRST